MEDEGRELELKKCMQGWFVPRWFLIPAASGWREEGIHDGGRDLRLGDQRLIRKSRFISLTLRIGFF
jgi:hypothetical protein